MQSNDSEERSEFQNQLKDFFNYLRMERGWEGVRNRSEQVSDYIGITNNSI